MKMNSLTPQHVVRTVAIVAGVLGAAFVAAPPAVEARGLPAPHEVVRELHQRAMSHIRHIDRFVDHSVRSHDGYRRDQYRRYPRSGYGQRYYRPSYRYPVVVGGYRDNRSCNRRGYVGAYVGAPRFGIAIGVRPERRVYRDDCDRNDDCNRNDYRNDDRRQNYDDNNYDDNEDDD